MIEITRVNTIAVVLLASFTLLLAACVDTFEPTGPGPESPEDEPGEFTSVEKRKGQAGR